MLDFASITDKHYINGARVVFQEGSRLHHYGINTGYFSLDSLLFSAQINIYNETYCDGWKFYNLCEF